MKDFCAMVRTQFKTKVSTIRSDNGSEFVSGPMKRFYGEQGIVHETSCVDTPQQNRKIERKHRHVLNVARALRFEAHLSLEFWGECVLNAAHFINRTLTQVLDGKTPYEALFGKKPSYDRIKDFGCLCYAYNFQRKKDKFGARSRRCIFVGYPHKKQGERSMM